MPAQKTTEQKRKQGTLKKRREATRKKSANPTTELQDACEALLAMQQNLKLATAAIAKKGLMISTMVADSHGKLCKVERLNPALKVQREAMRAITSLKKQIENLEEEAHEKEEAGEGKSILDFLQEEEQKP